MKRMIMALTIAAMGLFYSGTANAAFTQTTTGAINVDITFLPSCGVTTAPLSFGGVSGAYNANANATVTVNCSNGAPYRVDIDAGMNTVTASSSRRAKLGTAPADLTNTLPYALYKTNSYLPADDWGDNGTTYCTTCIPVSTGKLGTGTGADQVLTVYGYATSPLALVTPGAYTDTVTVTVNY